MKIQKKLLSVIVLLVVCFLFSACSMEHQSTAQFLSTSSNIFVNTKSPNVCAFNVALFSDHIKLTRLIMFSWKALISAARIIL